MALIKDSCQYPISPAMCNIVLDSGYKLRYSHGSFVMQCLGLISTFICD